MSKNSKSKGNTTKSNSANSSRSKSSATKGNAVKGNATKSNAPKITASEGQELVSKGAGAKLDKNAKGEKEAEAKVDLGVAQTAPDAAQHVGHIEAVEHIAATSRPREPATSRNDIAEPAAVDGRDPRLPAVGTAVVKRDRNGVARCECLIEEGGIRYKTTLYKSLSAAARAAAVDLGIKSAVNGFVFFGLSKPKSGARRNAE